MGKIMAYSLHAECLRRCVAIKKDGAPCKAWARWGDDRQLCSRHGGNTSNPWEGSSALRSKPKCDCEAYAWPHRPGSGLCRWPDQPEKTCKTPAGAHKKPRLRRIAWSRAYVDMMRSAVGDNLQFMIRGKKSWESTRTEK